MGKVGWTYTLIWIVVTFQRNLGIDHLGYWAPQRLWLIQNFGLEVLDLLGLRVTNIEKYSRVFKNM